MTKKNTNKSDDDDDDDAEEKKLCTIRFSDKKHFHFICLYVSFVKRCVRADSVFGSVRFFCVFLLKKKNRSSSSSMDIKIDRFKMLCIKVKRKKSVCLLFEHTKSNFIDKCVLNAQNVRL